MHMAKSQKRLSPASHTFSDSSSLPSHSNFFELYRTRFSETRRRAEHPSLYVLCGCFQKWLASEKRLSYPYCLRAFRSSSSSDKCVALLFADDFYSSFARRLEFGNKKQRDVQSAKFSETQKMWNGTNNFTIFYR